MELILSLSSRKAAGQRTTSDSTSSFRRSLLDAILDVLRVTPCAVSSGAVQWLFKLLTGFAAQADSTLTSFVCLELLELLSSKLSTARLREHLFLRARLERLLLLLLMTTSRRFKCVPQMLGSLSIHIFTLLFLLITYS